MQTSFLRSVKFFSPCTSNLNVKQLLKQCRHYSQKSDGKNDVGSSSSDSTSSQMLDPQYAEHIKQLEPTSNFLATLNNDQKQEVQLIFDQVKLYAYLGQYVPERLTSQDWKHLLESRDLMKRIEFLEFVAIKQRRRRKDAEEYDMEEIIARQKNRRQEIEELAIRADAGEMTYGPMAFQEIANPFRRKQRLRHIFGARMAAAIRIKRPIVGFDMQFLDKWSTQEASRLGKMLNYAFTDNFMSPLTFDLRFFNVPKCEKTHEFFQRHLNTYFTDKQEQTILPDISRNGIHEALKDAKNIVYLSRHARNFIDGPLSADAYVICASFDSERESIGASRRLGKKVYTASLPIDKYLKWERGKKALPLNGILRILRDVYSTAGDWESALRNNIAKRHLLMEEELTPSSQYSQSLARQRKEDRLRLAQEIATATGQEFIRE